MSRSRNWLAVVVAALAVLAVLAGAGLVVARGSAAPPSSDMGRPSFGVSLRSCPPAVRRLGLIAFTARGAGLELLDLARCRVTVLRRSGAVGPRFSPDGQWLAFGAKFPTVIPARGGAARTPLERSVLAWSWAPRGALLYGITDSGSLVARSMRGARRVLAANLSGAFSLRVSPDGRLIAVDRSQCGPPAVGELDTVDVATGRQAVVLRRPGHFLTLSGWSPDGRWLLFWDAAECSSSLAADGWPLEAVPAAGGPPVRAVRHMLLYDDLLTWCGDALIAAAGSSRETQLDSALVRTGPPAWRGRTIQPARNLLPPRRMSWVSPACAPGGHALAAAAGPANAPTQFGLEGRSIWLLRPSGALIRRLTLPQVRGVSDEAPRFSRDGRWVLFVRSRVLPNDTSSDTLELVRATHAVWSSGAGNAVPLVDFSSDDFSYYDHFMWPSEIDWSSSPR